MTRKILISVVLMAFIFAGVGMSASTKAPVKTKSKQTSAVTKQNTCTTTCSPLKMKPDAGHKTKSKGKKTISAICPVMGSKIPDVSKAAGKSVYKGKTYYFCCSGCKPLFDKNPEKYIKK